MFGDRLICFARPLPRSNLCASHRQRRWLTNLSYFLIGRFTSLGGYLSPWVLFAEYAARLCSPVESVGVFLEKETG